MPPDQDDDQDDVALDMDDEGDDGPVVNNISGSGIIEPRPHRQLSASTRELFLKGAKTLKAQLDEQDDEDYESVGSEDDPEDAPPAPTPAQAAAVPAAQAAPPPVAAPPAASLDPGIIAERERLAARAAELDKRDADLAARQSSAIEAFRERYYDGAAGAVKALLKETLGSDDESEVADAIADLIVELSEKELKLNVDGAVKAAAASRRAERTIKAHKREQKARTEKEAAEKTAAEQRAVEERTVAAIDREFQAAAATYPNLAAEEGASQFVWDVIKDRFHKHGERLTWQQAAALAEQSFKNYNDAWYARRKHLIAPPVPAAAAPASSGTVTRERANQGSTRRTVTNDMAAAEHAAAPDTRREPETRDAPLSNEERRARTKGRMRNAFRAASDTQ